MQRALLRFNTIQLSPGAWRHAVTMLVGLVGLMSGCQPQLLGPTTPSAYHMHLPVASQTLPGRLLALTVRVTDAEGKPVEDVPVHFHLPPTSAVRAEIDPPIVNTRFGRATTTLLARSPGSITVHVRVEDLSGRVDVVITGESPRF